jgi:hypothetical protein
MSARFHVRFLVAALALSSASSLIADPAEAALKKYSLIVRNATNSPNVTPNPDFALAKNQRNDHTALIDSSAGPNPVLRYFVRAADATVTTLVPALTTNIFVSNNFREGPGAISALYNGNRPTPFTGTGSIASGNTIRWGTVTGWTITGSFWCNSNPAVICGLAMGLDENTVDSRFNSASYDLGTWTFHGTGFVGAPFISSYNTNTPGNTQMWVRGANRQDGTVPALPLIGSLMLAGSLVLGGVTAMRRRQN